MTAQDQMRAMLDELMGTGRNGMYFYEFEFSFILQDALF